MKRKKEVQELRRELETYYNMGIPLWLDGRPSTPKSITKACRFAEEDAYMRDYVQNAEGKVERLQFDLVKK
ncbi:MAG: hypothetical protein PHS82_11195 [Lachnospiraceae bacterium]|nr:hypothetical protein [Lachnospiraceae bacterium]